SSRRRHTRFSRDWSSDVCSSDLVIYTATSWWKQCSGNYAGFAATTPLWIARYASAVGELPAGWGAYTMWQYTSTGPTVGDHNRFNGTVDRVRALALEIGRAHV